MPPPIGRTENSTLTPSRVIMSRVVPLSGSASRLQPTVSIRAVTTTKVAVGFNKWAATIDSPVSVLFVRCFSASGCVTRRWSGPCGTAPRFFSLTGTSLSTRFSSGRSFWLDPENTKHAITGAVRSVVTVQVVTRHRSGATGVDQDRPVSEDMAHTFLAAHPLALRVEAEGL